MEYGQAIRMVEILPRQGFARLLCVLDETGLLPEALAVLERGDAEAVQAFVRSAGTLTERAMRPRREGGCEL